MKRNKIHKQNHPNKPQKTQTKPGGLQAKNYGGSAAFLASS